MPNCSTFGMSVYPKKCIVYFWYMCKFRKLSKSAKKYRRKSAKNLEGNTGDYIGYKGPCTVVKPHQLSRTKSIPIYDNIFSFLLKVLKLKLAICIVFIDNVKDSRKNTDLRTEGTEWLAKKPQEEKNYFIEKREYDRMNTERQREKKRSRWQKGG